MNQEDKIKELQETIDFNVKQNLRLIKSNYEYHKMLYDIAAKLVDVHQLVSGWKGTTPQDEWSEFDQLQLDNLSEIQQKITAKIGIDYTV